MSIAVILALTAALLVTVYALLRKKVPPKAPADGAMPTSSTNEAATAPEAAAIPYSTGEIEAVRAECWKLTFKAARFDYQVFGEHATVLERIATAVEESVHHRDYFPRRPMLLPKLLQTLNDTESSRRDLVRLLLEDPALAGNVLKRANSAFYRVSPEPVESLDRAVTMLGTDGLKRIVATAILQPVFRQPAGYFEGFATVTWEHAQRAAVAGEAWAATTREADPFVAQLLALLGPLAQLVIFRIATEKYRETPNVLPRPEVFVRAMQTHSARAARLIAATWELADPSIEALEAQVRRISPSQMTSLGRAVYYGELCGIVGVAVSRAARDPESARGILVAQGLAPALADALWQASMSFESEG